MQELSFMGVAEPEAVRARVYGADRVDERLAFLRRLDTHGVLEAPAYDGWLAALRERGWLAEPEREPAPSGGHYLRWRLNDAGREALRRLES